ncbi:MAG: FAD-binding protein [Treponema sp.]|nr:FAD-binding protein [Treponema sp.]
MKNLQKTAARTGTLLLLGLMILGFAACASAASGDRGRRKSVNDGVYVTTGIGKSVAAPITVTTTFANNTLVDISIGANGETGPILDSVKTLMVPRIIQAQSIGVDSIAGATLSSGGVKSAIAAAIDKAEGKSEEWYTAPPKKSGLVKLTGYDVIVVGLGGSGMAAYVKASEPVTKDGQPYSPAVYGIEAAGKIGGNSATAGGPMAVNSQYIKDLYTGGADYGNRDALLREWYNDMNAANVPASEPRLTSFVQNGVTYPIPSMAGGPVQPYSGGPKWELIKQFIDASGETVTWLARNYNFHFERPSGLVYPQYNFVTNYGSDEWNPGGQGPFGPTLPGYTSDDGEDLFKTTMFTRAIERAKARNPDSGYKLELRATDLIMADGKVAGVKAAYRDGTSYEVYGKTVILATGGFIGNYDMKMEHFNSNLRTEAVDTERGDGIKMALAQGAGAYNIDMPAMVHLTQVKNIIKTDVLTSDQKAVLTALLLRGDGLVVGLHDTPKYGFSLAGKRFANEADMTGVAFANWKVGGYFASIISDDVLAKIKTAGMPFGATMLPFLIQGNYSPNTPVPTLDTILSVGEKSGNVARASTLEELAEKLGIAGDTLRATVTEYNTFVDGTATDTQYDKSSVPGFFGPPANYLTTKVTPNAGGYTAILGAGYYYGTTGGLDIDGDMQALNTSKQKIPGLYAVGQDSMGVLFNSKKAYVGYGAAAQGWAITSGRLAGANAAQAAAGN